MNSKNLKKTYFNTYEKFFMENSVVVSTPFVMNRSGDVLNNYSWISIKQQVPLRLYMWYSKNNTKTITINKIFHLDINEYKFIETNVLEYAPYFSDINKMLQKKYGKLVEKYWWIEINILSELPRWVGLWFGSLLALLLSIILHKIEEKIDQSKIETMKHKNINELLSDEYSDFYSIFIEALEIDKHIYGMVSSWIKLASFFHSYYPIISFSEDYDKEMMQINIKTKRYFWFKLNDLQPGFKEIPYLPIDYWIIYSGKPVLLEQIVSHNYKNNTMTFNQIKSDMQWFFGDFLEHLPSHRRPKFYKYFIQTDQDEFDITYGKLMWIISLKMLYYMIKIYNSGYDESSVIQYIDTVKKLRQADSATRDSSTSFLKFIKNILEKFQWWAKYFSIAPNDSTIMWWSILFVMPLEWFRKSLIDAVAENINDFPASKLIYSNWVDWLWYEGLLIEQDLNNNQYSQFLDWSNCIIKWLDWKIIVGDCDKSIAWFKTWLLLDAVNNKIHLNWQKLTSQDLHSQTATIDIMKVLIENFWTDVSNKNLPLSSYSKNKNDMIWKIVIPLIELIEKRTWKKLPLICKWSIYDFYLKLNKSEIDIAVIDKLIK